MASSHNKLTKSGLGECIEVSTVLLGRLVLWPKPIWQTSHTRALAWMDVFEPDIGS